MRTRSSPLLLFGTSIGTAVDQHMSSNRAAFGLLYAAFLGRKNGPRAGWLLATLDRELVLRRLREAGKAAEETA